MVNKVNRLKKQQQKTKKSRMKISTPVFKTEIFLDEIYPKT